MVIRKKRAAPNTRESFTAEVEALREQVRALQDEISWTKSAPLPRGEVKLLIGSWITSEAARFPGGEIVSGAVVNHQVNVESLHLSGRVNGRATESIITGHTAVDLAPTVCYLLGDVLRERLSVELGRLDYNPGPPAAERPALMESLFQQLRELEQQEEALIVSAEENGIAIDRRPDCSPEVVLGFQA